MKYPPMYHVYNRYFNSISYKKNQPLEQEEMYTAKLLNSDGGLTNTFHHEYADTLEKIVRNKFSRHGKIAECVRSIVPARFIIEDRLGREISRGQLTPHIQD